MELPLYELTVPYCSIQMQALQGPLYGFPDSMSTNCGFKVFQRMGSQCHVVLSVQHYQARAERGLLMNKEDTSTWPFNSIGSPKMYICWKRILWNQVWCSTFIFFSTIQWVSCKSPGLRAELSIPCLNMVSCVGGCSFITLEDQSQKMKILPISAYVIWLWSSNVIKL